MWWFGHKLRRERQQLEHADIALAQEAERERRVNDVVARIEEAHRRNHFGEAIERAMSRKRKPA
ncbi:DUF7620 family protein [Rhodococcus aetherivorans]|uniref:DUF7620 family protein n=1 Tax=Rhodococcus aetherivorans TaxID=191292 RepID=UPI003B8A83A6